MKQRKKSLKLLLSSNFRPLEESKEGKLLGGFAAIVASTGNNCSCSSSSSPSSSNSNTGGGTTTQSPSSSSSTFGLFGFF